MPRDRLRILVVSHFVPSRQSGGRVRLRGLLHGLAASHAVSLLAFVPPGGEDADTIEAARGYCDEVVIVPNERLGPTGSAKRALQLYSLLSVKSYQRLKYDRPSLQAALDRMCARSRYDVVHVEGCYMAHYAFAPEAVVVLDEQNIEYDVQRRTAAVARSVPRKIFNYLDHLKLRLEEERSWRVVDACSVASAGDEATIRRAFSSARTAVVPNAVDTEFFSPRGGQPERGTVLFFGELGYYPNTDAVLFLLEDVMPLIKASNPSVRVVVVGPSAPPEIRRWASPDVLMTGRVEDIRPYLDRAHVVVVPLRIGGGTRLKILEAMAMGKPIVSTRLGAEGLAVTDQRDILLADGARAIADQVDRVLRDDQLAAELGAAAHRLVQASYDWRSSVRQLEDLYQRAIVSHRSAAFAAPAAVSSATPPGEPVQ
ncbi:MAG: glycosyltransferase [Candidatus Limnocylindria bacterium]